jgi:hypothetical protein
MTRSAEAIRSSRTPPQTPGAQEVWARCAPSLARWPTAPLVHPAVLVPAELVGHRDARRGALDVVLRLHPSHWRDLQRVLPIQRLVVRPLPVALGFWRPARRAAPLVELELGGARVPRVFKRPDDGLREGAVRVAPPLLPPVLDAPALEDPVVLEGVDPVFLFEGDLAVFLQAGPDVEFPAVGGVDVELFGRVGAVGFDRAIDQAAGTGAGGRLPRSAQP